MDRSLRLLLRNAGKAVIVDPVGNGPAFGGVRADLRLYPARPREEAGHHGRAFVGGRGEHIEETDPHVLEIRQDPVGPDDLLLALTGVDPVLGQQEGGLIFIASQPCKDTGIAGCDRVVDIGLRHITAHHTQKRQQHGPHSVEEVRKSRIGVFFPADLCQKIHEILAGQKVCRRYFPVLKDVEDLLPVRMLALNQRPQGLQLSLIEADPAVGPGAAHAAGQGDFPDLHDIVRHGIPELSVL